MAAAARVEAEGRKPNFFVVGAAKAGTTSLYTYLRSHPQIYMSPVKEPHYFARDIDPEEFSSAYRRTLLEDYGPYLRGDMSETVHCAHIRTWSEYLSLFRFARDEAAIGEVSNSYLFSEVASREIQAAIPDARIVMVLRNPVDRAWSDYLMSLRIGLTRDSFPSELQRDRSRRDHRWGRDVLYVENGLYCDKVKRYLDRFGRDRVLVLLYDDLSRDTAASLRQVLRFLGVRDDWVPEDLEPANVARVPRSRALNYLLFRSGLKGIARGALPAGARRLAKRALYRGDRLPRLDPAEWERVSDMFRDDLRRLGELIGRDLSAWLQPAQPG